MTAAAVTPGVAGIRPSAARAWWLAIRPATLTAAVAPVAVGSACAKIAGGFRLGPALAALAGAAWIQIGTNLANDVFDAEKGADTDERLGPPRAVSSGLLAPAEVRAGMAIAFALAALCGLYLWAVAGGAVIAIGIASIGAGIAYTGGPWPLGYHGLGEAFVMLFFGFVAVCGTCFVEAGHVSGLSILAAIPVGALPSALLVVNNLRDRETDLRAGKRTLAVRFGARAGRLEYGFLVGLAFAVPLGLGLAFARLAALPLIALPIAIPLCGRVARSSGRALNGCLRDTARLVLLHGVLFAGGLAIGW